MPGFSRSWKEDGTIGFYEIIDFVDGYLRHRLIAITDKAVYFDGITFVKEGRDGFAVYVLISGGGKSRIIVVHNRLKK